MPGFSMKAVGVISARERSQGLVEFGLSVAVVAVVAIAGFGALSRAQSVYWGGNVQTSLVQPTPAPGDFIHPTQVSGSCTPPAFIYATISSTFTCSVSVTDVWTTDRLAPQGHVAIAVDGTTILSPACTLTPDAGGQPLSRCTSLSESWTPTAADVGVHSLVVQYTPDVSTDLGKHAASSLTTGQITVLAPVTVQFVADSSHTGACWNPYSVFASPDQFEVGHPEICHLTVTDVSGHGIASTRVQVMDTVPAGDPGQGYFSCFTNNQFSALQNCPNPGTPYVGNTDSNGELWMVYRRYYPAPLGGGVPIALTATMLDYPPNPPSTPKNVAVEPPVDAHSADMIVNCPAPTGDEVLFVAGNGQPVLSASHIAGAPGTQVTCTVVVFDTNQPFFASPPGNPDTEELYAPIGTVAFVDATTGTSVNNALGKPSRCTLSIGNSLPGLKPVQAHGLPSDAASCSAQLLLSIHQTIVAQFTPTPAPQVGHSAASSHPFDADFDVD